MAGEEKSSKVHFWGWQLSRLDFHSQMPGDPVGSSVFPSPFLGFGEVWPVRCCHTSGLLLLSRWLGPVLKSKTTAGLDAPLLVLGDPCPLPIWHSFSLLWFCSWQIQIKIITSNTYCLQCTEHKAVVLALEELTVFSAAPEFIGVIGTLRWALWVEYWDIRLRMPLLLHWASSLLAQFKTSSLSTAHSLPLTSRPLPSPAKCSASPATSLSAAPPPWAEQPLPLTRTTANILTASSPHPDHLLPCLYAAQSSKGNSNTRSCLPLLENLGWFSIASAQIQTSQEAFEALSHLPLPSPCPTHYLSPSFSLLHAHWPLWIPPQTGTFCPRDSAIASPPPRKLFPLISIHLTPVTYSGFSPNAFADYTAKAACASE